MVTASCQAEAQPTVLVIDDEAGPRDALKVILHTFYNVRSAENAKTALEVLGQVPIDVITLDQKLPDRHGLDLLKDIKHHRPEVEVIIVTGYGSLKSAMEGIRHGAAGYLLKPFNVNELTTLIQQTIDKKRRLDFLRHCLRTLPDLWGSEEESARAWDKVKTGYTSLSNAQDDDPLARRYEPASTLVRYSRGHRPSITQSFEPSEFPCHVDGKPTQSSHLRAKIIGFGGLFA